MPDMLGVTHTAFVDVSRETRWALRGVSRPRRFLEDPHAPGHGVVRYAADKRRLATSDDRPNRVKGQKMVESTSVKLFRAGT
jgi:hypothetical protein